MGQQASQGVGRQRLDAKAGQAVERRGMGDGMMATADQDLIAAIIDDVEDAVRKAHRPIWSA